MKRLSLVLAIMLVSTSAARADQATAAAAFNQAEAFVKQGKWAEACPFYETSYNADPQIGVLLHLADCHEHVGRTATAWAEFSDAVELTHRKGDPRESYAKGRADALLPKLAKLHLTLPPTAIPGLGVLRDNVDITVLVGTDIPIDPGDHELVASAPGYLEWRHKVAIAGPGTIALAMPPLDKVPDRPVEPAIAHEGRLIVVTQPGARISIDSTEVANGRFEGTLPSGGHTLRVVAGGMRPYQSEIVVTDGQIRTIDVPLEKDAPVIVIASGAAEADAFELGASLATGVKLRGDKPQLAIVRGELALRLGRRVNFGLFAEYGGISTGGSCGFDMPGPMPTSAFDFGERLQFNNCSYLMPGLQLYVHVAPKHRFDPYIGVAPGIRFGFTEWTPYLAGVPQSKRSEVFPAIVIGARAGLNYHPRPDLAGWEVGVYFESAITALGDEASDDFKGSDGSGVSFLSLLGGVRSTMAF